MPFSQPGGLGKSFIKGLHELLFVINGHITLPENLRDSGQGMDGSNYRNSIGERFDDLDLEACTDINGRDSDIRDPVSISQVINLSHADYFIHGIFQVFADISGHVQPAFRMPGCQGSKNRADKTVEPFDILHISSTHKEEFFSRTSVCPCPDVGGEMANREYFGRRDLPEKPGLFILYGYDRAGPVQAFAFLCRRGVEKK